jgi:urease accessory protein
MFAVISRSEKKVAQGGADAANGGARVSAPGLQKSFGAVDLVFARRGAVSEPRRLFQQGAMKVRFTGVKAGAPPEAVLLNLAGGLTGGDRLQFGIGLEQGSSAVITTQACERIYRSSGEDAAITGRIRVESGACLEWLPQATILFDGARLKRETHVELAADATLLALECLIFGRTARGETVASGALCDSWSIHRNGELIHAECFALDGAIQSVLDKQSVLNGHCAMATLRYIASDAEKRIEPMRALLADCTQDHAIVSAASAWNGMMIVRFVAPDGYRLNREIGRVLSAFRTKPLPRVWLL